MSQRPSDSSVRRRPAGLASTSPTMAPRCLATNKHSLPLCSLVFPEFHRCLHSRGRQGHHPCPCSAHSLRHCPLHTRLLRTRHHPHNSRVLSRLFTRLCHPARRCSGPTMLHCTAGAGSRSDCRCIRAGSVDCQPKQRSALSLRRSIAPTVGRGGRWCCPRYSRGSQW